VELRDVLGELTPSPEELRDTVAALLRCDPHSITLREVVAEEVAYEQPAITTRARYWVRGVAVTGAGDETAWSMFVKAIQPFQRSVLFESVPQHLRGLVGQAILPWQTEARVYQSDLADRLPPGLSVARAVRVDLTRPEIGVLWVEQVPAVAVCWDADRYRHAAYLLGRLAGSEAVRPIGEVGETDGRRGPVEYAEGRFRHVVMPALEQPSLWEHTLMAPFDSELRARMQRTARQGRRIADELDAYPRATAHGDACPNNLLVCDPARPDLVMIDFGFWSTQPVGFDLGQQQLGEAQLGRRSAADVVALDDQLVTAYVDGLRAESYDVACAVVRRAHALQMVLFSGLSAVPWELLDLEPTEERLAVAGTRADLARFTLDLLDATGGL
jgi:hypothetical protein